MTTTQLTPVGPLLDAEVAVALGLLDEIPPHLFQPQTEGVPYQRVAMNYSRDDSLAVKVLEQFTRKFMGADAWCDAALHKNEWRVVFTPFAPDTDHRYPTLAEAACRAILERRKQYP